MTRDEYVRKAAERLRDPAVPELPRGAAALAPQQRKTWTDGDPQPGRDVDKVRTADGTAYERWTLVGGGEHDDIWTEPGGHTSPDWGVDWGVLLTLGPLTDATEREPADLAGDGTGTSLPPYDPDVPLDGAQRWHPDTGQVMDGTPGEHPGDEGGR